MVNIKLFHLLLQHTTGFNRVRLVCNDWDTGNSAAQPLARVSGRRVRCLGQYFCYHVRILHFGFQAKPRNVFVLGRWSLFFGAEKCFESFSYILHRAQMLYFRYLGHFKEFPVVFKKIAKKTKFLSHGRQRFTWKKNCIWITHFTTFTCFDNIIFRFNFITHKNKIMFLWLRVCFFLVSVITFGAKIIL